MSDSRGSFVKHVQGMAAAAAIAAGALPASAHEVGTMSVTAAMDGRRYAVEITLDAYALLARLDAAAGRPRRGREDAHAYLRRLNAHRRELLAQVDPRFDGSTSTPDDVDVSLAADQSPGVDDDLAAPRVTVRFSGVVPAGAHEFSWASRLTFASYPLVVKRAGGNVGRVEWIEAARSSAPFVISPRVPARVFSAHGATAAWVAAIVLVPIGLARWRRRVGRSLHKQRAGRARSPQTR